MHKLPLLKIEHRAMCEDIWMARMVWKDIVKFLLIRTGMGFCFREFIQFEDHFGFFNDQRLRLDAFMYII